MCIDRCHSQTYGKIIISEYCLNNKYKTIKPATNKLGGVSCQ